MVIGAHLLNKNALLSERSYEANSDGQGGDAITLTNHGTNPSIKLRYHAASGRDREIAGQEDQDVTHVGYVLPTIRIDRDNRITVANDNGIQFDVIAVLPPSKAHHLKLLLEQVRGVNYLVDPDGELITLASGDEIILL